MQIARLRHERFRRSSERLASEVEQLELRLDEVLASSTAGIRGPFSTCSSTVSPNTRSTASANSRPEICGPVPPNHRQVADAVAVNARLRLRSASRSGWRCTYVTVPLGRDLRHSAAVA